jgi:hypothetical protein
MENKGIITKKNRNFSVAVYKESGATETTQVSGSWGRKKSAIPGPRKI